MARLARSEITIIDVLDGVDGDYTSYVFRNSEAAPSTPTDGSYTGYVEVPPALPQAWLVEPTPPTAPEVTWVSKARYSQATPQSAWTRAVDWSSPIKWTGKDGWNSKTINLFQVSATAPAVPNNTITYAFTDDSLTGSLDGWSTSTPSNTLAGGQIWITTNIARTQGTSDDLLEAGWSVPQVMSRNGFNGAQGLHGSGSYIHTTAPGYTIADFNSTFDGDADGTDVNTHSWLFLNIAGRVPQTRDVLSYVNDTATDPTLRFREDLLFNGTGWDGFVDVVNGNQIVHGTVAAEHLVAETITADEIAVGTITADRILTNTITADRIASNVTFGVDATFTGTLKIGTTSLTDANTINSNNTAVSVGADPAGSAAAAEAAAISTAATNSNSADKTSGTLGSWNIKTGYIYSGAVDTEQTANAYSSSGMTLSSAGAIRSPNFRVDSDGSAYFKGDISLATGTLSAANIVAQNIEGDVTDLKAKTSTFQSGGSGSDKVALSFTVSAMPFARTIVVSGVAAKFDGSFAMYNYEKVGGTFKLKYGTTTVDSFSAVVTASYPSGAATILSRPLVVALPASTSRTYTVTVRMDVGSSFIHSAQKILIQVFKDGSTIT